MEEGTDPATAERVAKPFDEQAEDVVRRHIERLETTATEDRKSVLQGLRRYADEQPNRFAPFLAALTPFLTDEERSIRLTTAKLFVAVAEADSDAVVPYVRISLAG